LHYGGFPELFKFSNPREYLSNIYMKVFYGDVIARNNIQNEHILKLLIKKLAESVNNETSINRIKNLIKSTGAKVGNNTLFDYLDYLFDSYLIYSIENFTLPFSEKNQKRNIILSIRGILNLFLIDQRSKLLEK
jgi:predicted AAA+ superfamily ATPase